jgi:hypothetical protein
MRTKSHFRSAQGIIAISILLCLLLTGCYFQPGAFRSDLSIYKDGSFTYRYVGELIFAFPERTAAVRGDPASAFCVDEKTGIKRPCDPEDLRQQEADAGLADTARRQRASEMAELIGFNPYDDAANRALAARIERIQGWNDVEYKGDGVFQVDYQASGNLDRDFVFPIVSDAQISVPIVGARRIKGNQIEIEAPGLASSILRKMLIEANGSKSDSKDVPLLNRANGTFTITTDAPLVSSNGLLTRSTEAAGKASSGLKMIRWDVKGSLDARPTALITLED